MAKNGTAVLENETEQEQQEYNALVGADVEAPSTDDLPAVSEFRQMCIDFPEMVHDFSTDELIADPSKNGRFTERKESDDSVKLLAKMIEREGQLQPGRVTLGLDGKLYITFGTGRYLAIKSLNVNRANDPIPFKATVLLETETDSVKSAVQNGMENWGREPLDVLDKCVVVGTFNRQGLKAKDICERMGLPKSTVSMYLRIDKFSAAAKQLIADGTISAKNAYDLAVVAPDKFEAELEKLVKESKGGKVTATAVGKSSEKLRKGTAGKDGGEDGEETDGEETGKGKGKKGKKQRTSKQVLDFIEAEAVIANAKKYGDTKLPDKLQLFGKFISGMSEATFLKNLATL